MFGDAGADGLGETSTMNGTMTLRNYGLLYSVFQLSGADPDPTICEVYFTIYNTLVSIVVTELL